MLVVPTKKDSSDYQVVLNTLMAFSPETILYEGEGRLFKLRLPGQTEDIIKVKAYGLHRGSFITLNKRVGSEFFKISDHPSARGKVVLTTKKLYQFFADGSLDFDWDMKLKVSNPEPGSKKVHDFLALKRCSFADLVHSTQEYHTLVYFHPLSYLYRRFNSLSTPWLRSCPSHALSDWIDNQELFLGVPKSTQEEILRRTVIHSVDGKRDTYLFLNYIKMLADKIRHKIIPEDHREGQVL